MSENKITPRVTEVAHREDGTHIVLHISHDDIGRENILNISIDDGTQVDPRTKNRPVRSVEIRIF